MHRSPRMTEAVLRRAALPLLPLLLVTSVGCQDIICLTDPDEEHLCEPQSDIRGQRVAAANPLGYTDGVAYTVAKAHNITLLETLHDTADIRQVPLPGEPTIVKVTPENPGPDDIERIVALTPEAQRLTIFTADDPSQRNEYPLGSPFTAVDISDDGRFAIAWYRPGSSSNQIVRNNNEMAVVDLARAPCGADEGCAPNPQLIPLRSLGSRPLDVEFAPSFELRSSERRLALILSEGYITLLELDGFDPEAPNQNETVVRFSRDNDVRNLTPQKIVWTDDDPANDDDVFAFVLVGGSDDIIGLNLLPGDELDALDRPRISPSLNQLTAGRSPQDVEVYQDRDGSWKLLAVNGGRSISVIDVATSDTVEIPLEESVNQIQLYNAVNRDTDRTEQYALLYSTTGQRSLLFVELETVEVRRTRAIRPLHLDRGISELRMAETEAEGVPRAVIVHSSAAALSILNLERRFVTPLDVTSSISDFTFADDQTLLTVLSGQPFVTFIDLQTGHPSFVELDLAAQSVEVIPATNTVLIDHGQRLGAVTVMRLDRPSRGEATTLFGFAAHELLEQEAPK